MSGRLPRTGGKFSSLSDKWGEVSRVARRTWARPVGNLWAARGEGWSSGRALFAPGLSLRLPRRPPRRTRGEAAAAWKGAGLGRGRRDSRATQTALQTHTAGDRLARLQDPESRGRPGFSPSTPASVPPPKSAKHFTKCALPRGLEAAGRGRGRPTWGAAQPRSPESSEPGCATAATRRRERSAASGGGERLQRRSPGLGESANIFQTTQTFLLSPRSGASLGWNCSPDSRGALGRDSSPGFLRGSANFAEPGTRGSRPSAEPSRRFSLGLEAQSRGFSPPRGRAARPPWLGPLSPQHRPQNWR
uniref:Uncharacterized protein n=1 Tax=Rangifer tarandus platyrhynchus TaxID=3082113 RepID=A0ACB0EXG7_RANTA|nr:unnamed protein product [Rangifer tarandus platyrhynchus]